MEKKYSPKGQVMFLHDGGPYFLNGYSYATFGEYIIAKNVLTSLNKVPSEQTSCEILSKYFNK